MSTSIIAIKSWVLARLSGAFSKLLSLIAAFVAYYVMELVHFFATDAGLIGIPFHDFFIIFLLYLILSGDAEGWK